MFAFRGSTGVRTKRDGTLASIGSGGVRVDGLRPAELNQ